MKFEKIEDKIVIYMPGENKVFSEDEIKSLVLKIMDKLSEFYKIELSNSYSVNFYRNEYYGIIIELIDDNIKFLDDIVNIDLNVSLDKLFLYEIDDPLEYIDNDVYFYNKKYYISPKKYDITIFEKSNVIYDDIVYKIIGRGVKI